MTTGGAESGVADLMREPEEEPKGSERTPKIVVEPKKRLLAQKDDKLYEVTVDPLTGEVEPPPFPTPPEEEAKTSPEKTANGQR